MRRDGAEASEIVCLQHKVRAQEIFLDGVTGMSRFPVCLVILSDISNEYVTLTLEKTVLCSSLFTRH